MALQLGIQDHPEAYHVVEMCVAHQTNGVQVLVATWADAAARQSEAPLSWKQYDIAFNAQLQADNPIQYSYELLKTQQEFAGALDV